MPTPVEVPKLGNTVEECLISRWAKRKGDAVAAGELVAEIETDKATFEVTAPVDGTLLETFFPEGALVPVYTNLFVIGEPTESAESFRPKAPEAAPAAAPGPAAGLPAASPAAAATVPTAAPAACPSPAGFPAGSARARGGLPKSTIFTRGRRAGRERAAG